MIWGRGDRVQTTDGSGRTGTVERELDGVWADLVDVTWDDTDRTESANSAGLEQGPVRACGYCHGYSCPPRGCRNGEVSF